MPLYKGKTVGWVFGKLSPDTTPTRLPLTGGVSEIFTFLLVFPLNCCFCYDTMKKLRPRQAAKIPTGGNKIACVRRVFNSEEVATFAPIAHFLSHLPQWDGQNHLARLFSRLPGVSSEQLAYLIIWLRSAVAHYWKPKNGNTMFVVCKCPDYVIWGLKKTPYLCTIEMKHSINNKK